MTHIDWKDASSVMGVASHWSGYLAYCTDIEQRTLDFRAVELMKKYGTAGDGNIAEDKRIMHHYDNIGLRCPYRKAHAMAALNGMLEVAAELKDGGAVKGRYPDGVFISRDFSNIRIIPQCKPEFIHRLAIAGDWSVEKDWIDKAGECVRLQEKLPEYKGSVVIGEYTHLKKAGDNAALEEYEAKISFFPEKADGEGSSIFGDSLFMQPTSKYLDLGEQDSEAVLLRDGYYTDFSNKSHWIAINPALAYSLGWEPSGDGYFAWIDANGAKMAESVYWQSGNINMFTRGSFESGEGWFVVVSKEAMAAIAGLATVYVHKKVLRRREAKPADMTHRAYIVDEIRL